MVKTNALLCAILSLLLYLFQSILFGLLTGTFKLENNVSQIISYLFALLIIILLIRNKERAGYFGFCKIKTNIKLLLFMPILFIPLINLFYLLMPESIIAQSIFMCIAYGIYVGIIEELIFRSFLFRAIEERINYRWAIIISSIVFGLFHIVNLNSMPIEFVILQIVYAMAIGIILSIIFYITQSLLPCIIIHALTNITGFLFAENMQFEIELTGLLIFIIIDVYCIILLRKHVKANEIIA
jgi:membrane protease YdiL (CAAX protease family)